MSIADKTILAFIASGATPAEVIALVSAGSSTAGAVAAGPTATAPSAKPKYFSEDEVAAGGGYPCSAKEPCNRRMRGPNRTGHGPKGHKPQR